MRFGVHLPNAGPFANPESITAISTAADRLGYDSVTAHDHVNWGMEDRYHFYAGSVEATDSTESPTYFYELMTMLSYIASITHRVRLIPYAISLSWRSIPLLAREALTLHQLSKGRFVFCAGAGNVIKDFEITGTPFEERQWLALDKLRVIRMLIDQSGPVSFQGNHVTIRGAELFPRPVGMPIWYAGTGQLAIKRAARYGEGWMPAANAKFFKCHIPEVLREAERAGRKDTEFEFGAGAHLCLAHTEKEAWAISRKTIEAHHQGEWLSEAHYYSYVKAMATKAFVGAPEKVSEMIREYKSAGVTYLNFYFIGHTLDSILEQMEMFNEEVAPNIS